MNDFVKIFVVVFAIAASFYAGQNYGLKKFTQTDEYKKQIDTLQSTQNQLTELVVLKTEIENTLQTTRAETSEQTIEKIRLLVGLTDSSTPELQNQKSNHSQDALAANNKIDTDKAENKETSQGEEKVNLKKEISLNPKELGKIRSYEWILAQADSKETIEKTLKNTELKRWPQVEASLGQIDANIFKHLDGRYKGTIRDVTNNPFAQVDFEWDTKSERNKIHFEFYREDKKLVSFDFDGEQHLARVPGLEAVVIENERARLQIYKNIHTQQIAGHYYERLVNGTTKLVGSFVLQKIPDFSKETE